MEQSPALRAVCKTLYSVDDPSEITWETIDDLFVIGLATLAMARDQINKRGMVPDDRHMEFIAGLILTHSPMDWSGQLRGRDVGLQIAFLSRPAGAPFPETERLVAASDRTGFPRNFIETMRPEPVGVLVDELQMVFAQGKMVAMNLASVILAETIGPQQRGMERVKVRAEAFSDLIAPQTIQIELQARKSLRDQHKKTTY